MVPAEFARCGRVCFVISWEPAHHNRKTQYTKSERRHEVRLQLRTEGSVHHENVRFRAVQRRTDPTRKRHRQKKSILSTGALAVFALAPKCAEVHFYGFTVPSYETWRHDLNAEHEGGGSSLSGAAPWH